MEFEKQFDEKINDLIDYACNLEQTPVGDGEELKTRYRELQVQKQELKLLFSQSIEEERKRIEGIIESKREYCPEAKAGHCSLCNSSIYKNELIDDLLSEIKKSK